MRLKYLAIALALSSCAGASANLFDTQVWQADKSLQEGKYPEALKDYLKVQAKDPSNQRLNYNTGIALYRLGAFENAQFNFQQAAQGAQEDFLKEKALYNLGNAFFKQEKYKDAIGAYEAALKIDPEDEDAKHNLELAKKKLQEDKQDDKKDQDKDKQNQDQNKDDQNKDQDKKDQDKDQQNKDQENKDEQDQNKDDQSKDQDQKNQNQQQQQKQKRKGELSPQELKMLLMQVKEGKPKGNALGVKSKTPQSKKVKEKPW